MIRLKIALYLFSFLLLAPQIFALDIYISPKGNDANQGTKDKPLATLKGARDRIRSLRATHPGENFNVIIAKGTYFLTEPIIFEPQDGGDAHHTVTYIGEPGSKPVFNGGLALQKFEKVTDQLWRILVPGGQRFEQLYVNNQRARRAQFPNEEFYQPKAVTETVIDKGMGAVSDSAVQKITLRPEQAALFNRMTAADLKNAVVTFYHKWDNTRKKILKYSAADTAFYITGKGMKSWNQIDNKSLYTIENVKSGLDAPGEWFLETDGHLYYVPLPGEAINNTHAYAPVAESLVTIEGKQASKVTNLHFKNLSFQVSAYTMPEGGNEPMQAAAAVEAAVMVDYGRKISFLDCEIAHTGSSAIWFRKSCDSSRIEHSYLHDLGAGGVKIGEIKIQQGNSNTNNIVVHNNIIRDGGNVFPCAVGAIIFTASDNELTHNEIANFRYTGVSVGWVWGYGESHSKRNKINFNHIHHLGWGVLSDMGGVYTLGPSEGTTVNNNVIHHIYATSYGGWGLYTDEGSTGIVMENNLVYACKSSGFHQHYGKENLIRNNIFYNQIKSQLEATRVEPHTGFRFTNNIIHYNTGNLSGIRWDKCNFIADSNAYWDTRTREIKVASQSFSSWQQSGKDVHSVIADPAFANPAKLNFKITNRSLLSQIDFKEFDYNQAGVTGDKSWKRLAVFDEKLAKKFDEVVGKAEKH